MKVFISWSGDKSKAVAELLDEWLQCVLQAVDPWMSSRDIDRGSLWFSEITGQLQDTCTGIICITKSNKDKPWILFEAGAIAKGLSTSRVCTLLIDLLPTDLKDPLAQFNATIPNREGMWQLTRTLNTCMQEKALKEQILEKVFNTYWPQFEAQFTEIVKMNEEPIPIEKRSEDDILGEILTISRNLDKRVRTLEMGKDQFYIDGKEKTVWNKYQDLLPFVYRDFLNGLSEEAIKNKYSRVATEDILKRAITDFYESNNKVNNFKPVRKVDYKTV